MKNIKKLWVLIIFVLYSSFAAAESKEVSAANRKTAVRCLKLAENCILNKDWNSALSQAELGLAYDESVSDLIYIKAMAQSNLEYSRANVIKTIQQAFAKDNWVNYNKNGARILYADLLSETGAYSESLDILNQKPLIYSADAELIRIKNYYRMGTMDSITQARIKLNAARKIYPADSRFPQLFFTFEMLFKNYAELSDTEYEIPELVQTIADAYIQALPDYEKNDTETSVMALMFSSGEQQQRLLKAIGEIDKHSPLYAFAALKTGIMSEEQAYNLFFEASNNSYHLNILEAFVSLIKNPGLCENLYDLLNSFSGIIYIDENLDLRNELVVQYNRGRPSYIKYDENNDQILEMNVVCDFGTPNSISFENENVTLVYEFYPAVRQINFANKASAFYFLNDDFTFIPFEMSVNKGFADCGVDFYIPYVNKEIIVPEDYYLVKKASSVEIKTSERSDSKVIYTVFDGQPVFASFIDGTKQYAYASMENGYPFVRYVDYDYNDIFETMETYDLYSESYPSNEDSIKMIQKIFGENSFGKRVYLKKVEIDRNSDTIIEYKEEFFEGNGKISFWDNDGNGLWDYEYLCYSDSENNYIEESLFYGMNGVETVMLKCVNNEPVLIRYNDDIENREDSVVTGFNENCYWIVDKGTEDQENTILKKLGKTVPNGEVQLIQIDEDNRFTVIRIDNNFYFKQLEFTKVDLLQLDSTQTENEDE